MGEVSTATLIKALGERGFVVLRREDISLNVFEDSGCGCEACVADHQVEALDRMALRIGRTVMQKGAIERIGDLGFKATVLITKINGGTAQ